jgi:hypothetical protein
VFGFLPARGIHRGRDQQPDAAVKEKMEHGARSAAAEGTAVGGLESPLGRSSFARWLRRRGQWCGAQK